MTTGRGYRLFVVGLITLLLAGSACLFSPSSSGRTQTSDYYSPVDTPEKLLANFKLAYQTKNIDAYMACLHSEFEFKLLETDWNDYTGDGVIDKSWGRDIEESYTGKMFASSKAEVIELTLDGNTQTIWYGDSTGTTLQLVRSFDLKVYYHDHTGEVQGSHALGDAVFLCKPDADGNYLIWRWEDQSET
jgi:hypothetical protein